MRTQAAPRWDDVKQRWQLNAQKSGVRRSFYSSKPGKAGLAEVKRKRLIWLDGQADQSGIRLDRAWSIYLEDVKARTGPDNYNQHEKLGRLYIIPRLETKRVMNITEQDWQDCINKAKGIHGALSKKTLMDLRGVITGFCRFARKSRMIEAMPEDLVIPSTATTKGKTILQPDQLKRLFEPSDEWYINAWRFMAVTGLRPGEVYGMQNDDIQDGILTIKRSLSETGRITPGKNKNARRQIKLHTLALEILAEQRVKVMHLNSPWTFCNALGSLTQPKAIYEHWIRLSHSRGIQTPPYALRHTFVSLAQNKLPPQLVKQIVGHSESMDTFGIYGHTVNGEMERAALLLDDLFSGIV